MKCGYDMCNNLGECTEDFVKDKARYYCKSCFDERQHKTEIRAMINEMLPREPQTTVNTVIKDLMHVKKYEWDYIIYALTDIKKNNKNLNYARGIQYYLNNQDLLRQFETQKNIDKYNETTKNGFETSDEEVEFSYKPTAPSWLKLT